MSRELLKEAAVYFLWVFNCQNGSWYNQSER